MERYDWNTFSLIIDPRLPGEQELLAEFEEHSNEQRTWLVEFLWKVKKKGQRFYFSRKSSCNHDHRKGQKK